MKKLYISIESNTLIRHYFIYFELGAITRFSIHLMSHSSSIPKEFDDNP
jgi:hypothetical protein